MFISASAAETETAGARLAGKIQAGDVLALVGDLGAGKTQFVKGSGDKSDIYAGA
jgi:tRNA threonylcarbamoyladenosine biosynthesis protein TsaE